MCLEYGFQKSETEQLDEGHAWHVLVWCVLRVDVIYHLFVVAACCFLCLCTDLAQHAGAAIYYWSATRVCDTHLASMCGCQLMQLSVLWTERVCCGLTRGRDGLFEQTLQHLHLITRNQRLNVSVVFNQF